MCRMTCASLGSFLSQPAPAAPVPFPQRRPSAEGRGRLWSALRVRARAARAATRRMAKPARWKRQASGRFVAGGLEGASSRLTEPRERRGKAIVLGVCIGNDEGTAPGLTRHLDAHLLAGLGDADGDESAGRGRKLAGGHGWWVVRGEAWNTVTLETC